MSKMILMVFLLVNTSEECAINDNLRGEVYKLVSSPDTEDSRNLYEIRKKIMDSKSEGINILNNIIEQYGINKISRNAANQITLILWQNNEEETISKLFEWYLQYPDIPMGKCSAEKLKDLRKDKLNMNITEEILNKLKIIICTDSVPKAIDAMLVMSKYSDLVEKKDLECIIIRFREELNSQNESKNRKVINMMPAIRRCGYKFIDELRKYSAETNDANNKKLMIIARAHAGDSYVKEDILKIMHNDDDYRIRISCIDGIKVLYGIESQSIFKEIYDSINNEDVTRNTHDPKYAYYIILQNEIK